MILQMFFFKHSHKTMIIKQPEQAQGKNNTNFESGLTVQYTAFLQKYINVQVNTFIRYNSVIRDNLGEAILKTEKFQTIKIYLYNKNYKNNIYQIEKISAGIHEIKNTPLYTPDHEIQITTKQT